MKWSRLERRRGAAERLQQQWCWPSSLVPRCLSGAFSSEHGSADPAPGAQIPFRGGFCPSEARAQTSSPVGAAPLQLSALPAFGFVPWTQQFRRLHVVRDLEIPSRSSRGAQALRKKAAAAGVISCRSLATAFLGIQSVGTGQIDQSHGRESGERNGASAPALVILLNAGCDGCNIGKITGHPGPYPRFRIVAVQDGNTGGDFARAVAPYDRLKTSDAGRPADRSRRNQFGDAECNGKITKASGDFVMG